MASIGNLYRLYQRQWTYCEAVNANWNEDLHTAGFIIDANPQSAKLRHYLPAIMVCSPMRMQQIRLGQCRWWRKQPNQWSYRHVAVLNGSATSFNNQNTAKTDVMVWRLLIWKVVSRKTTRLKHPWKWRETNINRQFCRWLEYAQVDLQKSKNEVVADGNDSAPWPRQSGMQKATCSMTSRSLQC